MSLRRAAGFTLIELALTLFIVVAVLATVVGYYSEANAAKQVTEGTSLVLRAVQNIRTAYRGQSYPAFAGWSRPHVPKEVRNPDGSVSYLLPGGLRLGMFALSPDQFGVQISPGTSLTLDNDVCVAYAVSLHPHAVQLTLRGVLVKSGLTDPVTPVEIQSACAPASPPSDHTVFLWVN